MKHLVKLKQAGRGMIALIAEDIISVKEVDPTISMGAPVKVNTLHSEYYIMQPFDKLVPIEVNSIRDNFLIVRGDKGRKKHPYANSVITFTDGHKEYFRESPIQIRKKIREASLC